MTAPNRSARPWLARADVMTAVYAALTIVMTWPIAAHLGSEIASDMGDPVFNCWVLSWTAGQVLAALHGHLGALAHYWDGNIFYPARLTLAFSEHLTPEMLEILPLYALTDNIVLCYNVLFLSTFVLSGTAMYMFVRDLTNRPLAAFVAGLAFAFAPYRLAQLPHVQVMASWWMPLALLGMRRYVATGRVRALVGATAAIVLQALSCGYYLFFFTPFVAAYAIYEMASRGKLADWRMWRALTLAAMIASAVIAPFAWPYLTLEREGQLPPRTVSEAVMFSADTNSFATAPGASTLWGDRLQAFPKNEAAGFPGFTILAFAAVGVTWGIARAFRASRSADGSSTDPLRTVLAVVLGLTAAIAGGLLAAVLVKGRLLFTLFGEVTMIQRVDPFATTLVVAAVVALMALPRVRRFVRGVPESALGFCVGATVVAAWLALGPRLQAAGQVIGVGPYAWLFAHVPGFEGLRVPARYLMIVALWLATLAGFGAAAIVGRWRRAGIAVLAIGAIAILAESWMVPVPYTERMAPYGFELTPRHLDVGASISPLYTVARDMPGRVVLIEFPFGEPAYDILAEFYAGMHRRPIVNGYSGFFPPRYAALTADLGHNPPDRDPNAATRTLRTTGATHAIIHEAAFPDGRGSVVSDWILSTGATLIASHGTDKLFRLR